MLEITSIPVDKTRGWTVTIDGKEQTVGKIEVSSKFGTLSYGLRPEGYDSWVFREQGGGGAVTLPYSVTPKNNLLVGLLPEKRANMGDQPAWCVIGGFVNPGEAHDKAQVREAGEEAGLDTVMAVELDGFATNSNRAFFVADATGGEGVHAFGLEIPYSQLELVSDGTFKFKDASLIGFKKAGDVRFFLWPRAVKVTADALTRSAIAQLLAEKLA